MRRVELPGNLEGRLFAAQYPGPYEPLEEFLAEIVKNISGITSPGSPTGPFGRDRFFIWSVSGSTPPIASWK